MNVITLARRAVRSVLREADRATHRARRARVLRRMRRRPRPSSLLFVCHGNICRSPYAARAMSKRLPAALRSRIAIESAGFIGPGRASPPEAVRVAAARDIDLSGHRSKLLTHAIVGAAEMVLVMDPAQQRDICMLYGRGLDRVLVLGDLDPQRRVTRVIEDPIDKPAAAYEAAYERIDRCADELARILTEGG